MVTGGLPLYLSPLLSPILLSQSYYFFLELQGLTNKMRTRCLFGEHLLTRYPERIVALVEAEKTALIGAGFIPEYNWLATGGRSGVNDRPHGEPLHGQPGRLQVPPLRCWQKSHRRPPRPRYLQVSQDLQVNLPLCRKGGSRGAPFRFAPLRTLPPFPASLLRKNLSPAGPSLFPWPRGATPPGASFPAQLCQYGQN